jgi:mannose-6-phosphate isomerase-like protein (cupin superfamily)
MTRMTTLKKLNVSQMAEKLDKPFLVMNIARVGDIVVSVYICQEMLEWHKHLDNDEMFWVCEGSILLESDWGKVRLRPDELSVVPKGIGHRSSADLRASVLLLRCGFIPERKNGHRRLYTIARDKGQKRISLRDVARALPMPFKFQTVTRVEDSVVQVAWGEGTWQVEIPASHDVMLFVLDGTATVRTSQTMLHMHPGELTVVPLGAVYQLHTSKGTTLARVTREDASPATDD